MFLIYVNGYTYALKVLASEMFADNTNFFYSHRNIKTLSKKINQEVRLNQTIRLHKIAENIGLLYRAKRSLDLEFF